MAGPGAAKIQEGRWRRAAEVLSWPKKRQALRALLGDRRLRVAPDEERGFLVEGLSYGLDPTCW
jgi:hypothetical protein